MWQVREDLGYTAQPLPFGSGDTKDQKELLSQVQSGIYLSFLFSFLSSVGGDGTFRGPRCYHPAPGVGKLCPQGTEGGAPRRPLDSLFPWLRRHKQIDIGLQASGE